MADYAHNTSHPSGIAATPTPDTRAAWDRAYHEYQRLCLLRDAYSDIGPRAAVDFEWEDQKRRIGQKYGSTDCPAARKAMKALHAKFAPRFEIVNARYSERVDAATVAMLDLMRAPCPDLDAAQAKFDICRWDVGESGEYNEEIWQAIEADLRRMVWEQP